MSSESQYTPVQVSFVQARRRADLHLGQGTSAAFDLPGCAYCGADSLASAQQTLNGEVAPPPDQPFGRGRIRVDVTIHRCRKHAKAALATVDLKKRAVAQGTMGMVIGAVLYFIANLVGASNGVAFFSSGNVVVVLLVGLGFIVLCAVLGEAIGRATNRNRGILPPAARVRSLDDATLEFGFIRPECAQDLVSQLKTDEERAAHPVSRYQ